MILIPGRLPDPHSSGEPTTWWGGLIYAIGVFSYFIGSIVFWLWFWGCFD